MTEIISILNDYSLVFYILISIGLSETETI